MLWAALHQSWMQKLVKSILDRVTIGTVGRADAHDLVVAEASERIHKQVEETAVQARATHMCVNLHVKDWVAVQQEDPILKIVMEWISTHKVQDLKHLLGDHTTTEEGMAILREWKKFMLHQGALYHCHTLARELEEVMQFIVPIAHRVAAMNMCHRDTGHQGQQWTLSLLQDQFWWPGMAMQMKRAISSCERCIQHEGAWAKAPLQTILVTSPLELLHVDFTNIEMMMELDQPPQLVNVLVFCDHFTRHIMAYVTPNQTAKTVAKFLWQGYISIFGALAKLLSDWGATFESNIISELCELMGIQKVRTLPYHPLTNGQVEWAHQTLMQMIGKLGRDQKADWPKHLPELVHAYNSIRLAITRYSPHYLMFGQWLCLPINFYFPTFVNTEKHQHVNHYVADLCEWLHVKPSRKCKCSPHLRLKGRGDTMIVKLMPFHWNQATWSWLKPMPTKGGERWKTGGRRNHTNNANCWRHPFLPHEKPVDWTLISPPPELTFSHYPHNGSSMYRCMSWPRCATTMEEPTQKVSENEEMPQSANCLPPAQHQTGETPLGWINRKLCAFLRMFSGASLLDQGWKVWCRGKRMCIHQHWHSGDGGTDHTDEVWKIWLITISSIPSLFILEIASSKHMGYETDTLACALIFGMITPSWTWMPKKLLAFHMLGTPTIIALPQWDKGLCSTN